MGNPFAIIGAIAEQKITEAMERGEFDNLPGAGKPLAPDGMENVPPELRMAWRILKNSGCLPPEIADRKEAASIVDLLENCPDEQEKIRQMRRLKLIVERAASSGRPMRLQQNDEYFNKILARLEHHERELKK